jgi:hypothetical protein
MCCGGKMNYRGESPKLSKYLGDILGLAAKLGSKVALTFWVGIQTPI